MCSRTSSRYPLLDGPDVSTANAKCLRKLVTSPPRFSNRPNYCVGNDGRSPSSPTPLCGTVAVIVCLRSLEQVMRIAARWIVACMKGAGTGPTAMSQEERNAMSRDSALYPGANAKTAITKLVPASHPWPAVIWIAYFHIGPKARNMLCPQSGRVSGAGSHHALLSRVGGQSLRNANDVAQARSFSINDSKVNQYKIDQIRRSVPVPPCTVECDP